MRRAKNLKKDQGNAAKAPLVTHKKPKAQTVPARKPKPSTQLNSTLSPYWFKLFYEMFKKW